MQKFEEVLRVATEKEFHIPISGLDSVITLWTLHHMRFVPIFEYVDAAFGRNHQNHSFSQRRFKMLIRQMNNQRDPTELARMDREFIQFLQNEPKELAATEGSAKANLETGSDNGTADQNKQSATEDSHQPQNENPAKAQKKSKSESENEKEDAYRARNNTVQVFLSRWGADKKDTVDLAVRLRRVYDRV